MKLLVELLIANLLQDVRVAGFIDLECRAAVRADDLMHGYSPFALARICSSMSGTTPSALSVAVRYANWFFARLMPAEASMFLQAEPHSAQFADRKASMWSSKIAAFSETTADGKSSSC